MRTPVNMKIILMAALMVASTVATMAQTRVPGKVPPIQPQNMQRQSLDQSDRLMVKSARQCQAAATLLKSALPIYHGHRVAAIKATHMAIREIHAGLRGDRNGAANLELGNNSEEGGRFTDEQVRRSNTRMEKAAEILANAKADLLAATKDYNGHRANAIRLVERALTEIRLGLDSLRKNP